MQVSLKISGGCGAIRHVEEISSCHQFSFTGPITVPAVTKLSSHITGLTPAQVVEAINLITIMITTKAFIIFSHIYFCAATNGYFHY